MLVGEAWTVHLERSGKLGKDRLSSPDAIRHRRLNGTHEVHIVQRAFLHREGCLHPRFVEQGLDGVALKPVGSVQVHRPGRRERISEYLQHVLHFAVGEIEIAVHHQAPAPGRRRSSPHFPAPKTCLDLGDPRLLPLDDHCRRQVIERDRWPDGRLPARGLDLGFKGSAFGHDVDGKPAVKEREALQRAIAFQKHVRIESGNIDAAERNLDGPELETLNAE